MLVNVWSLFRILLLPLILPAKVVQSLVTPVAAFATRSNRLRNRCSWLVALSWELGINALRVDTKRPHGLSGAETDLLNFFWCINTAYEGVQSARVGSRFTWLVDLDNVERRVGGASRIGMVLLRRGILAAPGDVRWSPSIDWKPDDAFDPSVQVPPFGTDLFERFASAVSSSLAAAMLTRYAGSVDEDLLRRQVDERISKLNAIRGRTGMAVLTGGSYVP